MVDIGDKRETLREASAAGYITMSAHCYEMVIKGTGSKGDVLGVARLAGIMAAKRVDELIPLTHQLNLNKVEISFALNDSQNSIEIVSRASVSGKTGVEMEALTAVSVAALTIYDMCKSLDKNMVINNIHLLSKTGGKSGDYRRHE